jgi:hypothetical protein
VDNRRDGEWLLGWLVGLFANGQSPAKSGDQDEGDTTEVGDARRQKPKRGCPATKHRMAAMVRLMAMRYFLEFMGGWEVGGYVWLKID